MSSKTITHVISRPMAVDTITIELPHYCAYKTRDWQCFCIIDEDKVIQIIDNPNGGLISINDRVGELLNNFDVVPIDRDTFIQLYAKVTDSFTKLLPYDGHQ
jgi:hypothetical protein